MSAHDDVQPKGGGGKKPQDCHRIAAMLGAIAHVRRGLDEYSKAVVAERMQLKVQGFGYGERRMRVRLEVGIPSC